MVSVTLDYQAYSNEALLGQYIGSMVSLFLYPEPRHRAGSMVTLEANLARPIVPAYKISNITCGFILADEKHDTFQYSEVHRNCRG